MPDVPFQTANLGYRAVRMLRPQPDGAVRNTSAIRPLLMAAAGLRSPPSTQPRTSRSLHLNALGPTGERSKAAGLSAAGHVDAGRLESRPARVGLQDR